MQVPFLQAWAAQLLIGGKEDYKGYFTILADMTTKRVALHIVNECLQSLLHFHN